MSVARWRGGRTWSAARNASSIVSRVDDHGLRLVVARRDLVEQAVRVGRDPRHLGERVHRGQPARAAPERVEADVRRDPVEPGADQRAAVERLARPPRPQERLLDGVLGLVERGQHPVAVDVELAPVSLGEGRERGLPTGERGDAPDRSRGDLVALDLPEDPVALALPGRARCCRRDRGGSRRSRSCVAPGRRPASGRLRRSGRARWRRRRARRARRGRPRCRSTHRCRPCSVPGAISLIPVPMAIEQAEPCGVSCTTRKSGPVLVSTSRSKPSLVEVERLGAVDVADGDDHQFERVVHGSEPPCP